MSGKARQYERSASWLKCSSRNRCYHLLKTFYAALGWHDEQRPDGTIALIAPTGHTCITEPFGAALFPALGKSTGELPVPPVIDLPDTDRTAMMPRRRQTREQDRQDRIDKERRQRIDLIAEQERQHQAWLAATYEPPPF